MILPLTRRGMLCGLASTIAAPAIMPAKAFAVGVSEAECEAILDAYGRSPGMDALPDIMQLQVMTRRARPAANGGVFEL
jgi:hypothetical protein